MEKYTAKIIRYIGKNISKTFNTLEETENFILEKFSWNMNIDHVEITKTIRNEHGKIIEKITKYDYEL